MGSPQYPSPRSSVGRAHNPHTTFRPAGSTPKASPKPKASTKPRASTSSHSAHNTSSRGGGHASQRHAAVVIAELGPPKLEAVRMHLLRGNAGLLYGAHVLEEPGMPARGGQVLGHHPKADGLTHHVAIQPRSAIRRAAILGYDSGSNTALVRLGDTPDSPIASVAVAGNLTADQMAAATAAYLTLNSAEDFGDATISTVV